MQNTVYERKQNSEDFFSLLAVTCFRFGNRPANGLVTEQPQYSVVVCVFSTSQNTEISLIPNGLCLIFTYSLLLALLYTFHIARHSFACLQLDAGTSIMVVQRYLGHKNVTTTEVYAKISDAQKRASMGCITLKK